MCGLAGWISTKTSRFGPEPERHIAAMQRALRHRGPDGAGAHIDRPHHHRRAGVVMGFTRLAIRDTGHGAQPMHGGHPGVSERVVSTVNGEIYDERALDEALSCQGLKRKTACDAELVAHGASVWGRDLWPMLNGMFAAAVWRPDDGQLVLSRDSAGMKPLYVALVDEGRTALWGSELGAVLSHPALSPQLDPRGLQALLWLDYVPAPGSLLKGVYKVRPGESWVIEPDDDGTLGLQIQRWGSPTGEARPAPSDPVAALDAALDRAVARRLVSDRPLCVFLSGGVDSSLVALSASRHVDALDTVSVAFDDDSYDESRYAREVAQSIGSRHQEVSFQAEDGVAAARSLLDSLDEPLADPSLLVTYHLCEFASQRFTVALGGDGGDEAWLGYPTFSAMQLAHGAARAPALLRALASAALSHVRPGDSNLPWAELAQRFTQSLGQDPLSRHLSWIGGLPLHLARPLVEADDTPAPWDAPLGWGAPKTWLSGLAEALPKDVPEATLHSALLSHTYLAEGVLQKVDRASMAHGLEVRAPWLDPDVRALAASLPPNSHRAKGRGKLVPRALARRHLPDHVATRKKKGFGVPLSAWLRGPLRDEVRAALSPDALADVACLNAPEVERLVRAHLQGRSNHPKTLWALWRVSRWWSAITSSRWC